MEQTNGVFNPTNINITSEDEYKKIAELQKKKIKVMQELNKKGMLTNGAVNDFDHYEYFSEAQYKKLFLELFSEQGITLAINELSIQVFTGTQSQPFGRIVTCEFMLKDQETGYSETTCHSGEGIDRGDKAIYKAKTGALKSFLGATFLVSTQDDPEKEDEDKTIKKVSQKSTGITPGQTKMIKSLFKNKEDVDTLKKELNKLKKKKIEELTVIEASKIIDIKKEKKDE